MLYDCPDNKTMNTKALHPHPLISLLPLAVLMLESQRSAGKKCRVQTIYTKSAVRDTACAYHGGFSITVCPLAHRAALSSPLAHWHCFSSLILVSFSLFS